MTLHPSGNTISVQFFRIDTVHFLLPRFNFFVGRQPSSHFSQFIFYVETLENQKRYHDHTKIP